jgi:tetratricopeptide (TPR) repeat protein
MMQPAGFYGAGDVSMFVTQVLRHLCVFATAALLVTAVGMNPLHAAGTDDPPKPSDCKKKKTCAVEEQEQELAKFLHDYRAARELIVTGHYKAGIRAMHAIGRDEHPDVANYIGYAYRRLGDYDNSKVWYEAALKADPAHVRTWSYYGMWQAEQGNRLKALDNLQKVAQLCGNTTCTEYRQLKDVIEGKASY